MDVLAVSRAAAPIGSFVPPRPAEAPKPADKPAETSARAPRENAAAYDVPRQKQLLVEPIQRFAFGYTFVDAETREVISKWPVERIIPAGERVELVA